MSDKKIWNIWVEERGERKKEKEEKLGGNKG